MRCPYENNLLILLRHCSPCKQYRNRYIGHSDIEIDKNLFDSKKIDFLNKKFDLIYSSPLQRCTQTLDLLGLNYTLDNRLKEVKFKDFVELKNFNQISKHKNYNDSLLGSYESWFEFICDEDIQNFKSKIVEFLSILPKDKNILVCTHKGVIDMVCKMQNLTTPKMDYLDTLEVNNWDI